MNPLKSAVDKPRHRKLLGFTVSRKGAKLKVADKAIEKLTNRVWEITRRTRGTKIGNSVAELRKALLGWKAYLVVFAQPLEKVKVAKMAAKPTLSESRVRNIAYDRK